MQQTRVCFLHRLFSKDESPGRADKWDILPILAARPAPINSQSSFSAFLDPRWGNFVSLTTVFAQHNKERLMTAIQNFPLVYLCLKHREDECLTK